MKGEPRPAKQASTHRQFPPDRRGCRSHHEGGDILRPKDRFVATKHGVHSKPHRSVPFGRPVGGTVEATYPVFVFGPERGRRVPEHITDSRPQTGVELAALDHVARWLAAALDKGERAVGLPIRDFSEVAPPGVGIFEIDPAALAGKLDEQCIGGFHAGAGLNHERATPNNFGPGPAAATENQTVAHQSLSSLASARQC